MILGGVRERNVPPPVASVAISAARENNDDLGGDGNTCSCGERPEDGLHFRLSIAHAELRTDREHAPLDLQRSITNLVS